MPVTGIGKVARTGLLMLLPLLALAGPAMGFKKGDCLEITRVDRWDFLYIRSRPDAGSTAVGAIAVTSSNPLVITGGCTPNTRNTKRLWCPVVYYATRDTPIRGWVKMYFTRQIECPPSADYYN